MQTGIVIGLVTASVFYLLWKMKKAWKGKSGTCCGKCGQDNNKENL